VIWSVIFQVLHFPALRFGPSFSRSCILLPCDLVRHFPGPAFSSHEIWSVVFQVLHFPVYDLFWSVISRSCKFSAPVRITVKLLTEAGSLIWKPGPQYKPDVHLAPCRAITISLPYIFFSDQESLIGRVNFTVKNQLYLAKNAIERTRE